MKKMGSLAMSDTDKTKIGGMVDEFSSLYNDFEFADLDKAEEISVVEYMGRQVLEICSKDYAINRYFLEVLQQKQNWLVKEEQADRPLGEFISNSNSIEQLKSYQCDINQVFAIEELPTGKDLIDDYSDEITKISNALGFDADFLGVDDLPELDEIPSVKTESNYSEARDNEWTLFVAGTVVKSFIDKGLNSRIAAKKSIELTGFLMDEMDKQKLRGIKC